MTDSNDRKYCHSVVFGRGPQSLTYQTDEMVRERQNARDEVEAKYGMVITRLQSAFDSYQKSGAVGYLTQGVAELLRDIGEGRTVSKMLEMFHSTEASQLRKQLAVAQAEITDLMYQLNRNP